MTDPTHVLDCCPRGSTTMQHIQRMAHMSDGGANEGFLAISSRMRRYRFVLCYASISQRPTLLFLRLLHSTICCCCRLVAALIVVDRRVRAVRGNDIVQLQTRPFCVSKFDK